MKILHGEPGLTTLSKKSPMLREVLVGLRVLSLGLADRAVEILLEGLGEGFLEGRLDGLLEALLEGLLGSLIEELEGLNIYRKPFRLFKANNCSNRSCFLNLNF